MKEQGLRFNDGKLRYDLLEPYAIEQLVKIFTMGSKKYEPNNWLKGLPWMDVVASLERHLAEFKKGDDFDKESQLLHMAHVAWNAMAIVSYYKHRPEFDNRRLPTLNRRKIGLDIDEVLCDWITAWKQRFDIQGVTTSWFFDRQIRDRFAEMDKNGELDVFYSNLKPLLKAEDIPFEPHCYITSRPCKLETSIAWLDQNGFPTKPVYCVGVGQSKVEVAKQAGIDTFVDDSYDNFVALNNAGICCYLYDAPHNHRYDVGYKRIYSLKELV